MSKLIIRLKQKYIKWRKKHFVYNICEMVREKKENA